MSSTWRGAEPEHLAPLTGVETLRAGLRLVAMVTLTATILGLFLVGRAMRAVLGRWVTFHFALARLWARGGLWLTGLQLRVEGRPVTAGALVANHCSWIDILALRAVTLIYFVAKSEVRDWPLVGFITRVTGTVFIERRRSHAKRQEEILRERIAAKQLLAFFPEGTSTDGLRVLPFKSSLFSVFFLDGHGAELWVQPVTIRYLPDPRDSVPPSFYGWWGDMSFEGHVWQVMARSRRGRVEVIFHDAVRPGDFADRKALAEHAGRIVVAGHAGGPPAPAA
ncbi:1-acyl-sn-glycerol-3-phosphate acyltransferase [Limibaculum sp. FT325]|uniref:lysophospholipid acyltransferase family protein n=1 Tax=Thermohalobaculum sediminis TaxID=2939436 RepID=UPI0020C182E2|nr:lysophospholipid acyltransferase family protein [Limibaculum sediminis]MCL5775710.1 1-acyl-sn-glycerol-3-phosphate acyltransferase [Limibaculum sediminis]